MQYGLPFFLKVDVHFASPISELTVLTLLIIIVPDIAALVGDDGLVGQLETILRVQLTQVCLQHDVKTTFSAVQIGFKGKLVLLMFVVVVLKVLSGQIRSA